jgi:pimeloyl-ACP methyl ester carboxylesterase
VLSTVTLRAGRTLEYAELGDPDGVPVLFHPGSPGTAQQGLVVADGAREHGVRLISVSRPGYAGSTVSPPGLTPAAADSLELADLLGLEEVVVMGISGGGPFALALAALAPDRVSRVEVLGGPGEHSEVLPELLDEEDRRAIELAGSGDVAGATAILMSWCEKNLGPIQGLAPEEFHLAMQRMAPPEPGWLDEHPDLRVHFEEDFRRAIERFDGFVRDNLSWLAHWDFDLGAVASRVHLVHGESDGMVPRAHGDWLAARLPQGEQHVVPGGHGQATFGAAIDAFAELGRT